MKRLTTRSLVVLTAVTIAALALAQLASARTDRQTTASATTIQVKGGEFYFKLSTKSIARPGKVTFVFKNIGHVTHDFKINGRTTPKIGPGKTARLIVTFKKKGKFSYLCTVPGHAAAGMKGVFTVR
jgi:uncharacterized cupredoxin-like copper-binding protein